MHLVDFNTGDNFLDVLCKLMDAAVHRRYLDVHVHGEKFIHYYLGYLDDARVCLGNSGRDLGEYADLVLSDYGQNSFLLFFHSDNSCLRESDNFYFEKMNHPPAK